MAFFIEYPSCLGSIILESDDGLSLSALSIKSEAKDAFFENSHSRETLKIFDQARKWLDAYFKRKKVSPFDLPLSPHGGGDFARSVWRRLCSIPYGETATYGELAKEIVRVRGIAKMSAQAVGGAVGRNPIAIIIPCHRVVGANGNLTGYAGGLELKVKLLKIEGAYKPHFFFPRNRSQF